MNEQNPFGLHTVTPYLVAPADYPHGDRYGGIKDDQGNTYWVVTHQG